METEIIVLWVVRPYITITATAGLNISTMTSLFRFKMICCLVVLLVVVVFVFICLLLFFVVVVVVCLFVCLFCLMHSFSLRI